MFDLARALTITNIRAECPDLTAAKLRVKIFQRTYENDFAAADRDRIIAQQHRVAYRSSANFTQELHDAHTPGPTFEIA